MDFCVTPDAKEISEDLRRQILSGSVKVGDLLPTMRELAKTYGCSLSLVSKALTILANDGLIEQRKGVGSRVLKDITGDQSTGLEAFAFVYPSAQHEGIRRVGQGVQQASHEVGRRLVTLTTGLDFRKEAEVVGRLSEFDVKGAVVYAVLPEPVDRLYFAQMLMACRFPVVLADLHLAGFGARTVEFDNFHAGYTMTRHLLSQGLRKVGFLSNSAWAPSIQHRYTGYRWALEESGVEEQSAWVSLEPDMHVDFKQPIEESHALTMKFLQKSKGLEGVVCGHDFLALSCMTSAQKLGMNVPKDLKVVGIDDFAVSAQRGLTTYHSPYEGVGRRSVQLLNSLLQGEESSARQLMLRGELIVRKSG